MKTLFILIFSIFLFSCENKKDHFLLQTTIDEISEIHQQESLKLIKDLMYKLYLKNPKELKKNNYSLKEIEILSFKNITQQPPLKILNNTRSLKSIYLAFNTKYSGDRIFALIYGLSSMLMDAYQNKNKLIITDTLEAQKFYNLARNFEIVTWMLNNKKKNNGKPFLISNSFSKEKNISFERLLGKLISQQDMMSNILITTKNQTIKTTVFNVMSALLLPV